MVMGNLSQCDVMDQIKHDRLLGLAVAIGHWVIKGEIDKMIEGCNWLASLVDEEDYEEIKEVIKRLKELPDGDVKYKPYIDAKITQLEPAQTEVVDPFNADFE